MRIWQAFATLNTVTNDSMGDKNSDTIQHDSNMIGGSARADADIVVANRQTSWRKKKRNEYESQSKKKTTEKYESKWKRIYIKWAKNVCTMDNKPHARVNPKIKTEANSIHVEKNVQARLHFFIYISFWTFRTRIRIQTKNKQTNNKIFFLY